MTQPASDDVPAVRDGSTGPRSSATPSGPAAVAAWPAGSALAAAVAALVVLGSARSGYAAVLAAVAVLVLALALTWPHVAGSRTPRATGAVLAVSGLVVVAGSLSERLRWVAGAAALGILLSFLHQIGRRTGRQGLVVTLLASFGGLVLTASGALLAGLAHESAGRQLLAVTMVSVVAGVLAELVAGASGVGAARRGRGHRGRADAPHRADPPHRADRPARRAALAGGVAGLALVTALLLRPFLGAVPLWQAGALSVLAALVSWAFRRVVGPAPARLTRGGQLASGIGSVLAVGALPTLVDLVS
ncbi:MAG TPA: hypothetical protein VFJ94_00325 [Intrasporangium sp.]|uniref:hypothetical protein n=1 Tax=Intrasporangium sp. TaxID=1925024 RepID=UPI002D77F5AC|nr:hypothetical protein [Intrasporangium sp.]HET7396941.1 hypothetical protein [Intrasporangium sp.]